MEVPAITRHVAVLIALCACSKTAPEIAPIDAAPPVDGAGNHTPGTTSKIVVSLTPDDVQTDLGVSPITVTASSTLENVTWQQIAANLQLRSYPSLAPLPFQANIMQEGSGGPTIILVTPANPIGDHWAVLSVSSLPTSVPDWPQGLTSDGTMPNTEPSLGALISHFTPGHVPVFRWLAVAVDGGVDVRTSEGIDASSVASGIQVSAGGASCPVRSATAGVAEVTFTCPAAAYDQGVHLTVKGLRSANGSTFGVLREGACDEATLIDTSGVDEDLTNLPYGIGGKIAALVERGPCFGATSPVKP